MDYKQKYEEALSKAQQLLDDDPEVPWTNNDILYIFPELKLSKEERIISLIKQVLSESTTEKDECYSNNGVTQQEVFDWLEKQGEQKLVEWSEEDCRHRDWILELLADMKRKVPEYAEQYQAAFNWLKSLRQRMKGE